MNNLDQISRSQLHSALNSASGVITEARATLQGLLQSVTTREVTFEHRVGVLLSDASPEALERTASFTSPTLLARQCDSAIIRLLRDGGVNPLILLLIEILLHDGTARMHLARTSGATGADGIGCVHLNGGNDDVDKASVMLRPKVWWDGSKLTLPRGSIPDTAMAAMTGRTLRDLVEHPSFGRETITRVETTNLGTIAVHTDRRSLAATWTDALDIGRSTSAAA